MSVIKVKHEANYTIISNHAVDDETLTSEALGVLLYLMSKPHDWIVRPTHLQQRFSVGRDKMQGILKTLEDAGYIRRERLRDEETKAFAATQYVVMDVPDHSRDGVPRPENPVVGEPQPEKPSTGKPAPANPQLLITDLLPITECTKQGSSIDRVVDEAYCLYNEMAGRTGLPKAQRLTGTRKAKLRARLKDAGGIEGWKIALAEVEGSTFLTGSNKDGWRADLDFVLQESSFTKLMEGAYRRGNSARRDDMEFLANYAGASE